jgi:hypothetical protein
MTATGFSIGLGCAAIGLGISAAPARQSWSLVALLLAVTGAISAIPVAAPLQPQGLTAMGCSTIAMAALAFFGTRVAKLWWPAVANLGLWFGISIHGGASLVFDLGAGLPFLLLRFPAAVLRTRGLEMVNYVVASWVITASFIGLAFKLLSPAGTAMDHVL